jgi:hypothetical protein
VRRRNAPRPNFITVVSTYLLLLPRGPIADRTIEDDSYKFDARENDLAGIIWDNLNAEILAGRER